MPDLYYTAITRQTADGYEIATETIGEGKDARAFIYAEHFEDEGEAKKRARQFESQARQMDAIGETHHKVYTGTEPPEAYIVRLTAPRNGESETPESYQSRVDALAAKAGAKTVSVIGEPEHDDSQENRPVPPVALARSAVEVAEQAVKDAQEAVADKQKKLDTISADFFSTDPNKAPPAEVKRKLILEADENDKRMLTFNKDYTPPVDRRRVIEAQFELDQAQGRLYHAETELQTRQDAVKALEAEEKKHAN